MAIGATRAATFELDPIDPDDPGTHDYPGPLLADLRLEDWSASALRRIAEEVCLQGHLLALSFLAATRERVDTDDEARDAPPPPVHRGGRRGRHPPAAPPSTSARGSHDAAVALARSPGLLPTAYTGVRVESGDRLLVHVDRSAPAAADGAWPSLLGAGPPRATRCHRRGRRPQAAAARSCPTTTPDSSSRSSWVTDERPVPDDVRLTEFSTGADFAFVDRGTPVVLGRKGGA